MPYTPQEELYSRIERFQKLLVGSGMDGQGDWYNPALPQAFKICSVRRDRSLPVSTEQDHNMH